MDMQNVSNLVIPEGEVRAIYDKDSRMLWGRTNYNVKYAGEIYQQTYSGFQLLKKNGLATPKTDLSFWGNISPELTITPLGDGWARITASSNTSDKRTNIQRVGGFEWDAGATYTVILEIKNSPSSGAFSMSQPQNAADPFNSIDGDPLARFNGSDYIRVFKGVTKSSVSDTGLRAYFYGSFSNVSVDLRLTIISGDHTNDYQYFCGENWQPYVGGITSPNPDYPQEVQTVTGEQTVTVAGDGGGSQSHTISLGPIELCKISDYQDYLYKSGDDWYVHKETGKQIVNVSTITLRSNYSNVEYGVFNKPNDYGGYGSFGYSYPIVSTHAIFKNNPPSWDMASNAGGGYTGAATTACWIGFAKGTGLDNIKSALSGLTNYYALAAPTDTQITDATLIGQLNDVHEWLTRYGYSATVTGDLPIIIDKTSL